jgi:hypothetical protein
LRARNFDQTLILRRKCKRSRKELGIHFIGSEKKLAQKKQAVIIDIHHVNLG